MSYIELYKYINLLKLKNLFVITLTFVGLLLFQCGQKSEPYNGKTIKIKTFDGIEIKADVYENKDTSSPIILLFHQADFSRGEYRQIAPKLNKLGFTCISIDQRSGKEANGILNETHIQALDKNLKTEYLDALPDLKATINYTLKQYKNRKIILWGSSYSASLVFILGNEYQNNIAGIIAFSPGEYFKYNGRKIKDYASNIKCPTFITSNIDEEKDWAEIYKKLPSTKYSYIPKSNGQHGAKALWDSNEGHEMYWKETESFLSKIRNSK